MSKKGIGTLAPKGRTLTISDMGYSKLHSSLVNSSLWSEPDHVRLLFITLLAMCDKDGCVYGSRPGLERAAMLDPDDLEESDPWLVLMSPDKHSSDRMRAPENEGRRIEEIPGGFRLLNFAYYRGLRNDDDRAEQNRLAQARFRAKQSASKPSSATVSHGKPPKAHAEADAEAESEEKTTLSPSGTAWEVFEHYRKAGHERSAWTPKRKRLIEARLKEGFSADDLKAALDGFHASPFHRGDNDRQTIYLDLELLLRDAKHVEEGLSLGREPKFNAGVIITRGGKPIGETNDL